MASASVEQLSVQDIFDAFPEWKPDERKHQHCSAEFLTYLLDRLHELLQAEVDAKVRGASDNLIAFEAVCDHTLTKSRRCRTPDCSYTNSETDRQHLLQLHLADSVQAGLDAYFADELIADVKCNCGPGAIHVQSTTLKVPPELILCQLKRFEPIFEVDAKTGKKIPVRIQKQHKPVKIDPMVTVGDCAYVLKGIIVHEGSAGFDDGGSSGHYYTLTPDQDGHWLKFNDSRVDVVSAAILQNVEGSKTARTSSKRPTAYVLAYSRIKPLCVTQFGNLDNNDIEGEDGNHNDDNGDDIDNFDPCDFGDGNDANQTETPPSGDLHKAVHIDDYPKLIAVDRGIVAQHIKQLE